MQVQRLTTLAELMRLRHEWSALAHGLPFADWPWLTTWWQVYAPGELFVLAVREGDRLVGLAPWYVESSRTSGRVVRFLGSGDICSDYVTVLAGSDGRDAIADALAEWLFQAANSDGDDRWDLIALEGIALNDPVVQQLAANLTDFAATVHRRPGPRCWRIALPDSWDAYLAALSKSHRKQVRRVTDRLLGTGRAVVRTVESDTDLTQCFPLFANLHERRRVSLGETFGIAASTRTDFLQRVSPALFAVGQLRLHLLEIDGTPAAAEFQLAGNGVTYAYQSGLAPELLDQEPGRVITAALVQRAIAERQTHYDFLRGDEPYKAHWRAEPVESLEYRIVPNRVASQVRHGVWLVGNTMKHWMRSGLPFAGRDATPFRGGR